MSDPVKQIEDLLGIDAAYEAYRESIKRLLPFADHPQIKSYAGWLKDQEFLRLARLQMFNSEKANRKGNNTESNRAKRKRKKMQPSNRT